jgi:hypothetical protein
MRILASSSVNGNKNNIYLFLKKIIKLGMVGHAYNPSYLEGRI